MLREALELEEERTILDRESFAARRQELEERLDALIAEGRRFSDPDNVRLAKRLRKQREHLFTFLELEEVEVTNNRAKREPRRSGSGPLASAIPRATGSTSWSSGILPNGGW